MIRKSETGFNIYGTPWLGEGHIANPGSAPLKYLFLIRHGKERHEIRPLGLAELTRLFFQQSYLPHWDNEAMEKTAVTFQEIAEQRIAFELPFLKNPDVVEFLESFDKTLV